MYLLYSELMKVCDIIRLIEKDGWRLRETRGSHRQFTYPVKPGKVTVPGQPGADLPPGLTATHS